MHSLDKSETFFCPCCGFEHKVGERLIYYDTGEHKFGVFNKPESLDYYAPTRHWICEGCARDLNVMEEINNYG